MASTARRVTTADPTPPWEQPGWLDEISAWIHAGLARHGLRAGGPIDQLKVAPWSTLLRVPAGAALVYCKAIMPPTGPEVALSEALARWRPDAVPPILAADVERGWLLQLDGGARLREIIRTSRDFRHWERVLPHYAELQIEMAARVPELLALGLPDRRLSALPAAVARLLEDTGALLLDAEEGLSTPQVQQLRAQLAGLADLCAQLAGYGIPETLNHGDLGDANVFMTDGRPRLIDWGDAAVAHPFFSLRTTFVSLEYSLEINHGAPELDRLRDVYLEAWSRFAPPERLRPAFALARRLATLSGALAWHFGLAPLPAAGRNAYAHAVPSLLQEFLELGEPAG